MIVCDPRTILCALRVYPPALLVFVSVKQVIQCGEGDIPVRQAVGLFVEVGKCDYGIFSCFKATENVIYGIISFIHAGIDPDFIGLSSLAGEFHNGAVAISGSHGLSSWHGINLPVATSQRILGIKMPGCLCFHRENDIISLVEGELYRFSRYGSDPLRCW